MRLPLDLFVASIESRKIYLFSSEKINDPTSHYFVCIKRTNQDLIILSCCTSQYEKRKQFLDLQQLPYDTLVWISPKDDENPFSKDTFVDCNSLTTHTVKEFSEMYEAHKIDLKGELDENHFHQIINGLNVSPLIDEETKLIISQF